MPSLPPSSLLTTTLLLLIVLPPTLARDSAHTSQFQTWYAEYRPIFQRLVSGECNSYYLYYLNSTTNATYWSNTLRWLGSGPEADEQLTVPLVNCLLEKSSEFMKSDMASANVLLGLAPTILAALGNSIEELSLLSVVGRRPLLTAALAAGSPSIVPIRPLEYNDPLQGLELRKNEYTPSIGSFRRSICISIIEYCAVAGTIANVAELSRELGFYTVLAFAPDYPLLVLAWVFFAPVAHLWAAFGLVFRLRRVGHVSSGEVGVWPRGYWWRVEYPTKEQLRSFWAQFVQVWGFGTPTEKGNGGWKEEGGTWKPVGGWARWLLFGYSVENLPLKVELKKDNRKVLVWNTVLAVMTSCHLLLGTLVFSSMLFISARDGTYVLGRFMISVLLCRAVLMYELAKLRMLYHMDKEVQGVIEMGETRYQPVHMGK